MSTPVRALVLMLIAAPVLLGAALSQYAPTPAFGSSAYASAVLGDTPVSYWRLDETAGTTAADSASGGNNGTITGGVTLGVPGALQSDPDPAMSFNGSTGYINVGNKANLNITGDITVEGWAKPVTLDGNAHTIAQKGDANPSNTGGWQYRLSITSSNQWKALVYVGTTSYAVVDTVDTPSTTSWTYLVMTRAGSTLTLYINGKSVGTATAAGSLNTGSGIFAIGRGGSYAGYYWNGSLDEVAVYSHALTAAQVQNHYNAALSGTSTPTATTGPTSTPVPTATPTSTPSSTATPVPTTSATSTPTSIPTPTSTPAAGDPAVMAAGDIACDPTDPNFNGGQGTSSYCQELWTSNELTNVAAVLPLGDEQYACATTSQFQQSYDPSWGHQKPLTHPAAGNHEYGNSQSCTPSTGSGYYTYFGAAASPMDNNCTSNCRGYYSYDIGTWHVVVLNSECSNVGGCSAGSPQELWLQSDLAAHSNKCTLAYWHRPLFTSGWSLGDSAVHDLWVDLYNAGADVVLNGHDHDYERFAPQDPSGNSDPSRGIREFVVGTGGDNLGTSWNGTAPNSQFRALGTFGVLKLTLHPTSYDWQFIPDGHSGSTTDSGSASCH